MKLAYIAFGFLCLIFHVNCVQVIQTTKISSGATVFPNGTAVLQNNGTSYVCQEAELYAQGSGIFATAITSNGTTVTSNSNPAPITIPTIPVESIVTGSPDVVLYVPSLSVQKITLDVENLKVGLSLSGGVASLVRISAGISVSIGKVTLEVQQVQANALLVVRLKNLRTVVTHALTAVKNNPQIIYLLKQAQSAGTASTGTAQTGS